MISRRFLTAIGATTLGFGLVIGAATAMPNALAQEATAPVEVSLPAAQSGDLAAQRVQAYDSFVAALASELGADDATVDAAIRTALKQQIAAWAAEADLDAERVAELQAEIDTAEAPPLFLGFGGPGERGGFQGFEGEHRGPRGGFDDRGPHGPFDGRDGDDATEEAPEDNTPPATLPSADDASDQSAPAAVPTDGVEIS